eukprot:Tbor_TRINITY_DN4304_c0_g1::TRINITY_DN4304_c0_g1_i1::g.7692::m.7692/K04739/PRKAR; cAMP-dependent protein kinase regulator
MSASDINPCEKRNTTDDAVSSSCPGGSADNTKENYNKEFKFLPDQDTPFIPEVYDDNGNEEENTMTEQEDQRRRMTTNFRYRYCVFDDSISEAEARGFSAPKTAKDDCMKVAIMKALEPHYLFSYLEDVDLSFLVDVMKIYTFNAGEYIIRKNCTTDELFVVCSGSVTVTETTVNDNVEGIDNYKATYSIGVGGTFGEQALLYDSKSPQTIIAAASPTICWSINRRAHKSISLKACGAKYARYEDFLSNVSFLSGTSKEERRRIARALKSSRYNKGDKIIKMGEEGVWFYIILEGVVDVMGHDDDGKECHICSLKTGDSLGELEFIYGHKNIADCVAATDIVRTAGMTAKHFENVIGPAREILERNVKDNEIFAHYREKHKYLQSS